MRIFVVCLALMASACTYDPKSYEDQRKADNAAHDKQGY